MPTGRLSFESRRELGYQVTRVADRSARWLGDWLAYSDQESDCQHLAELSDLAELCVEVARKFPVASPGETRSASVIEVSALPADEQDVWLTNDCTGPATSYDANCERTIRKPTEYKYKGAS